TDSAAAGQARGRPACRASALLDEFRLQLHGADAADLAVDAVITTDQANVLHFGTHLDHLGCALDLEVLYHGDGIAVLQHIAMGVPDYGLVCGCLVTAILRPLVSALGADVLDAVFIGVFGIAGRAIWQCAHDMTSWKHASPDRARGLI